MSSIHLILRPWISGVVSPGETGPITMERKIGGKSTVGDLVKSLAAEYPALTQLLFDPHSHEPVSAMAIVVNDRVLQPTIWLNTPLNDNDTVALIPFLDGG